MYDTCMMNSCRYIQYYNEAATYRRERETVVVRMASILCILLACHMVVGHPAEHPVHVHTSTVCAVFESGM